MLEETLKEQLRICAEHGAENYNDEIKCQALVSIAISLKRIADKMEISHKQPIIMSAEEYARYQHNLKEF